MKETKGFVNVTLVETGRKKQRNKIRHLENFPFHSYKKRLDSCYVSVM